MGAEKVELRPEVRWFAEQMEIALRAKDHKPGWKADSEESLLDRLHEEVAELRTEILSEDRADHVVKEAVDVANFAMMIADVARGPRDAQEAQEEGLVMGAGRNKQGLLVKHVKHAVGWWFDTLDEINAARAWFQKAIEAGCDTDTLQSPPRDFTIRRMTLGEFESLDEA